ncbi:MAG: hypothetical protein PHD63_06605 [Candidatus Marinimicrobia bacterium]|nr:hypothetical protein [Candidatus Neomarinimicrobiota bacterium]
MRPSFKKKNPIFLLAAFFWLPFSLAAQDLDSLLAILESHRNEDIYAILGKGREYHMLYAQAAFENRTYFSGRDIGIEQWNVTFQTVYFYRGFSAAAATMIYSEFEPRWNLSLVSAAYRHTLSRKLPLDLSLSYERYCYHDPDDSLNGAFPNALQLNISVSRTHWGAALNPALFFGSGGAISQESISFYGDFRIWRKNDLRLRFRPRLSLIFGSEISTYTQFPGDPDPQETKIYGLLNSAIEMPLILHWKDLDLAVVWHFNLPRAPGSDTEYEPTSLFGFSLGYLGAFSGK